ncbi:LysE family transporter [Granulosicoccaceae sp. 1_MG-2023]|nr:LysE family transporter [Granulosicoccaceae sp. 1_MG-2023]
MGLFEGFLAITLVHLLAAATPGPDFVMVTQQSLTRGRYAGVLCSLGIALGLSVHIVYSSLGMAALVSDSSSALAVLKIAAGAYLIYLGIQGLRSRPGGRQQETATTARVSGTRLIAMGFLCNALNPKAPLYFVSVFTLVLSPDMPFYQIALYGVWMMLLQFVWFSAVAMLLSKPAVKRRFQQAGHWIDRSAGAVMLAFGIKLFVSRAQ